mmetsp:Transcript_34959/g.30808  ORF Transcript_34959/g.30808 Transcript_34959/m.30808 type:complete len:344 (-) Transcript_34959:30-1061(-)
MASDWICYVVSGIYSTLIIGCLIGFKINYHKKQELKQLGSANYDKNKKVLQWKNRFYFSLFCATICRISALIGATIYNKKLLLSKAETENEFYWQIAASFGSLLYFSSFSLIIWFFARVAYYKQDSKQMITLIITSINCILYCSQIMLAISDGITKEWDLIYDVALPLFSICNFILSFFFVFFSCKIASKIKYERKETVDYHIEHSYSATVSRSAVAPKPILKQASAPVQQQGDNAYIVPRLVKLSILCASMWIIRGLYTMSLRFFPSSDDYLNPIKKNALVWEAIFYCITEYPPSLGALFLMILRPKRKDTDIISQHNQSYGGAQESQYPRAKDQHQSLLYR